mgnify:CR=1 FL=1
MQSAPGVLPVNLGIIMDGNGRWAKRRFLPRSLGHDAGMKRIVKLVDSVRAAGIKYLTLYALSTENLSRPQEELDGLYVLFRRYFEEYAPKLVESDVEIRIIGDLSALPQDVAEKMTAVCARSKKDAAFHLVFAVNYGGRAEIVRAANLAAEMGGKVTEENFSRFLYTRDIPDPDMIIRTGGELRLSNFLLWQSAYSELYFTDTLFPDFDEKELGRALREYARRNRRFGRV